MGFLAISAGEVAGGWFSAPEPLIVGGDRPPRHSAGGAEASGKRCEAMVSEAMVSEAMVSEVMRCGHVQEWHGRLGMPWELWVCSKRAWLVSETPSSVTEN